MKPTRRRFVQQLTGLGLASASALSTNGYAKTAVTVPPGAQTAFASSFVNVPDHYKAVTISFDKALPENLKGTLYRNGPSRMVRGDTKMQHWFDGDGMINAFRFDDKQLHHQGKMVLTDRYVAEQEAGRYLWNGFGTTFPNSRPVSSPDKINPANTSLLPIGDDVLALWEAGSPWRVDAKTLETKGRHVFSPDTDGMPFSAHPKVDPDGRIWNFGYMSGTGKLVVYDINKAGKLNRVTLLDEPQSNMVHDFAVTERYLVFILMPFGFDQSKSTQPLSFLDRLQWQDDKPVVALVVDKESLGVVRRFEIPPFFAFHFGNAWQDGETIRVDVARGAEFDDLMQVITLATNGERIPEQAPEPSPMRLTLNLKTGGISQTELPISNADFPRYDQRFTGLRTTDLFMMGSSSTKSDQTFGFNSVLHIDSKTEKVQSYDYGAGILAEEHIFVSNKAEQGNGWLVGTAFNWQAQQTIMSVFDAKHIQDGPISQATLPYSIPLGLHGQFVAG